MVVLLAIGAAIVVTIRQIDGHALVRAVGQARPGLLALAALAALSQLACRSVVFRTLMVPITRISWFRAFRYALAGAATSSVAPGRAGDFLRMALLKRDGNVPLSSSAAVMVVDKIVDMMAMFLVLAPAPWLLPNMPPWVGRSMLVVAGLAVALFVAAGLVAKRTHTPRWLARFHEGLSVVRRPSLLVWALLPAILSWFADFACIVAVMRAVGIAAPAAYGFLILLAVNLAITVPVAPANLGAFELAVLAVFTPLGLPTELSLVFALLYHMAQVLPVLALALLDSRFSARSQSVENAPQRRRTDAPARLL